MILMKPHSGGMDGQRLGRIDDWMSRWVENSHLPNLMVAVQRQGRLVYLRHTGARDVENEGYCRFLFWMNLMFLLRGIQ